MNVIALVHGLLQRPAGRCMTEIRHGDFRRMDLNLLVGFDAMMLERHVGRTAARMFIGQPAMSHMLARLRESLEDELFVRTGNSMEPTPLALELAPQVREWLNEANQFIFLRQSNDLNSVKATVRISTIDGIEPVLLPALMTQLRSSAPGIRIWIKQLQRSETLPALDADEVDIALGIGQLPYKEWHSHDLISVSGFECVYSSQMLTLPKLITPQVLSQYEHVALSWRGETGSEIDQFFDDCGVQRNIAVSVVSQLAVMQVLRQFPLVSLQSSMVTSIYRSQPDLTVHPIEVPDLAMDVRLVWHRRNDQNLAHAHVRKLVKELLGREPMRHHQKLLRETKAA